MSKKWKTTVPNGLCIHTPKEESFLKISNMSSPLQCSFNAPKWNTNMEKSSCGVQHWVVSTWKSTKKLWNFSRNSGTWEHPIYSTAQNLPWHSLHKDIVKQNWRDTMRQKNISNKRKNSKVEMIFPVYLFIEWWPLMIGGIAKTLSSIWSLSWEASKVWTTLFNFYKTRLSMKAGTWKMIGEMY